MRPIGFGNLFKRKTPETPQPPSPPSRLTVAHPEPGQSVAKGGPPLAEREFMRMEVPPRMPRIDEVSERSHSPAPSPSVSSGDSGARRNIRPAAARMVDSGIAAQGHDTRTLNTLRENFREAKNRYMGMKPEKKLHGKEAVAEAKQNYRSAEKDLKEFSKVNKRSLALERKMQEDPSLAALHRSLHPGRGGEKYPVHGASIPRPAAPGPDHPRNIEVTERRMEAD